MAENYKKDLDHKVFDVEILLISVVQGVALAALAANAMPVLAGFKIEFYLYVFAALLIILTFWSQAIIHTLSFISWPIDMFHNFFYFLVSFVEVLVFSELTNPLKWFMFMSVFFVIAAALYIIDLFLIKRCRNKFKGQKGKVLYNHILNRQVFELKNFIPLGFVYSIVSAFIIYRYQQFFIEHHYHIALVVIQILFALTVLIESLKNFKKRSELISANQ